MTSPLAADANGADNNASLIRMPTDDEFRHGHFVVVGLYKTLVLAVATLILWDTSTSITAMPIVRWIAVAMTMLFAHELMNAGWTLIQPEMKGFVRFARIVEGTLVVIGLGLIYFGATAAGVACQGAAFAVLLSTYYKYDA
ncbi:MAG: hypothetical protein JO019_01665 [Candidatus Kaiserbacteria bacterium]|nr:hypothetical protein [Candidatus Kaiserbacteria bacterium]